MKLNIHFYSGILIFFISIGISYPQQTSQTLTPSEIKIAVTANIDTAILKAIRTETDSSFSQLSTTSYVFNESSNLYSRETTFQKGIVFNLDAESSYNMVFKFRDEFLKLGCLIFILEKDKGMNNYTIAVISSTDQFDILRLMQTNGENYNITNSHIITKLQEWNGAYAFRIIGANADWVEAQFIQKPENAEDFANEVYEFCPDIVDNGSGSVKYLAKEINDTGMLYLWWE